MRHRLGFALALSAALAPSFGAARTLYCAGPRLNMVVELGESVCRVNGRDAALRQAAPEVVCHISNPQLRILRIATDNRFTWEDTDDDRVIRGTCTPQ